MRRQRQRGRRRPPPPAAPAAAADKPVYNTAPSPSPKPASVAAAAAASSATPCDSCDGSGKVQTEKKVSVNIPAGIQEDNLLRINVEGVGDELFLRVSIRPHPLFKRHGDDLHLEIPVSIVTAALGGEVTVPTVKGGHLSVTIPGGVQSGQVLRMSGAGVPNLRSGRRGNLMCQVTVETPVNLSAKQKDLLRELDDSLKNKHEPKKKSWLDQVKDLFTD